MSGRASAAACVITLVALTAALTICLPPTPAGPLKIKREAEFTLRLGGKPEVEGLAEYFDLTKGVDQGFVDFTTRWLVDRLVEPEGQNIGR